MNGKKCYFSSGNCDGNCSKCVGAESAFQILLRTEIEKKERNERYDNALKKCYK